MIKNKIDLKAYYDDLLHKNTIRFQEKQKNETNQLKTYILENHVTDSRNSVEKFLSEIFNQINDYNLKILETEDSNLFIIKSREGDSYLDITDKRFWILHSNLKADFSDKIRKSLVKQKNMDSVWLPRSFLNSMHNLGEFYGFGLSFTEIMSDDPMEKILPNQKSLNLDMRRWHVKEMYELLNNSSMSHFMGMNKISILNSSDEENSEKDFIIDDITFFGKITGKGTSFSKHELLTQNLLAGYSERIKYIEKYLSFNYDQDSQILNGAPIDIILNRESIPLKKLVDKIFSGNKPFRMLGIPLWKSENKCFINAVDLHNGNYGQNIEFELTKNRIRIILPSSSCANTISRLLTNLQQSIDATATFSINPRNHNENKDEANNEFFRIVQRT